MTATFPGYAVPAGTYAATHVRHTSLTRLLLIWGGVIAVAAVVMVGVSSRISPPPAQFMCPPDCGRPPTGEPVNINPVFTAADGSFSVSYPAPGSAYQITTEPDGVMAEFTSGDGGTLQLLGEPADHRTPQSIVNSLVHQTFPDTETAYEIPNAMVGYQPGYGLVADYWPKSSTSKYLRMRVLVMAAVKNDVALIAAAVGPYRKFDPDSGAGKPSGANLQLALDMGKYVNSFRWAGDPAR